MDKYTPVIVNKDVMAVLDKLNRLQYENERLREALIEIQMVDLARQAHCIARVALAEIERNNK